MHFRRICFVTGTRAEYGLLYWLMKDVVDDPDLEFQLIVTGTHLEPVFGNTVDIIERDGFTIDRKIPLGITGDAPADTAKAMARALSGVAEALSERKPDLLVLLGDRYETLAAAAAALLTGVPIAHIHGGELTEGAIDDSMRHAITKMAHFHFTAAEPYRMRVIQMGEDPKRVFNVGAVGLDNIVRLDLLGRMELSEALGFDLSDPYFLVTYHPETLGDLSPGRAVGELIKALDAFPGFKLIITGVNADPGHSEVAERLNAHANAEGDRVLLRQSLGQRNYLSAMKHCAAVVGNSSSGIIEAPAFPVPTVNIGDRQKGRIRSQSVIDCAPEKHSIRRALRDVLAGAFTAQLEQTVCPVGEGKAAGNILAAIKSFPPTGVSVKSFCDMPIRRTA